MDATEMRAFQLREETGYLPDDVYVPTEEDDPYDPDQAEVRALVEEQYAATNAARRDERLRRENSVLRGLLEQHGIGVPDEI